MIPARCEKPSKCKGVDKTNATVVLQTPQSALGSNCLPTTYFCFKSQSLCPVTGTELWKSKPGRDDSTEISDISTEISDQLFIQAGPQFCVMFLIQAENAFTLKQIECSLKSLKSSQTIGWKGFVIAPSQKNTAAFLLLFQQLKKILFPLHFLVRGFADFMRHFIM